MKDFLQTLSFSLGMSVLGIVSSAKAEDVLATVSFEDQILPMLEEYCYRCHGESEKIKGDVDLTAFQTEESIFQERRVWLDVLDQIESEEMPTKDPLPSRKERELLVSWIDAKINAVDWTKVKDAGHVTIPLLNKAEYNNTVRDLLGISGEPGRIFSDDGEGQSGFTTDRDNLFLTTAAMEKYFLAAESALNTLLAPPAKPIEVQLESEDMFMTESGAKPEKYGKDLFGYQLRIGQMTLYDSVEFPSDGEYVFEVRGLSTVTEQGSIRLRIDNEIQGDLHFDDESPSLQRLVCFVPKGSHQLSWNIQKNNTQGKGGKRVKFAGAIAIDWMKVSGPQKAGKPVDRSLVFHTLPGRGVSEGKAASEIISRFARRAARRPLDKEVTDRYVDLYEKASASGENFTESVKLALTAVLVSPHFLYRHELAYDGEGEGEYALNDYQLASRLSYFLWMSMPDDELFLLAEDKMLRQPEVLRQASEAYARGSEGKELLLCLPWAVAWV